MTSPTFDTRHSYAGLRALVILGLCAALTVGFLFETWRAPTQVQLACRPVSTAAKC